VERHRHQPPDHARTTRPRPPDPAGHARAATATITDLEQLAQRYQALHATADPVALLTPLAAHIRMATAALGREHTAAERRRFLRNLSTVATLAGRLAYENLGDAASGRSYYSLALDSAREANDHQTAATVLGHSAQLAYAEGMTTATLDHLTAALTHAEHAPAVAPGSRASRPLSTPIPATTPSPPTP
jgi:hypothetical protein